MDKQTNYTNKDRQTNRWTDGETDRWKNRLQYIQTHRNGQTDGQTDRQMGRRTDGQTDRRTDGF
jgi:hypothetical protein